jgi:hypothetical protein
MRCAAVPKASIYKNRKSLNRKDEIGFPDHRPSPPPAGDVVLSE